MTMTAPDDFHVARFVIEHQSGYRLEREERLVRDVAQRMGCEVQLASLSQMQRRRVVIDGGIVAIGRIPFIKAALMSVGRELPPADPYPLALRNMLHRDVRVRPLRGVLATLDRTGEPFFIKPASRQKAFTGFVARDTQDFRLQGVSRSQDVWVASPAAFVSEWRVYVLTGEIFHVSHYEGDARVQLDMVKTQAAVAEYVEAGAPAGFAIDFGVLADGNTALVEANDGFSVGAYGDVPPEHYTRMLVCRWRQMAGNAAAPG